MLKIGDWVTQYSVGFWQVTAIYPKFADDDYQGEKISWKKGERLGDWVVLKKALTPKMKFSNACEFVDSQWCKAVSQEQLSAIEAAFAENPKAKQKFDKATSQPKPMVAVLWFDLPEERVGEFEAYVQTLPERFTTTEFRGLIRDYAQYEKQPPAGHVLYLFSYPWEQDDRFDLYHFEPRLVEVPERKA